MQTAPGWTPVPDDATTASAPGWTPAPESAPTFRTTNAKDAQGNPVVSDVASAWKFLNTSPLEPYIHEAASAISDWLTTPKAKDSKAGAMLKGFAGGAVEGVGNVASSFTTPIGLALTAAGMTGESALVRDIPALKGLLEIPAVQKLQRAVQVAGGVGFTGQGASDTFGPDSTLAQRAQGIPEMAAGLASALTGARPSMARPAPPSDIPPRLTPIEAASNSFADAQGIPLDAATRTGSRTLRAMEKRTANSIGGEGTAERLIGAQQQGLQRAGADLASRTGVDEVRLPEDAGASSRDEIQGLIRSLHDTASKAYDELRGYEDDPQFAKDIPSHTEGSPAFRKMMDKLAKPELPGAKPAGQPVLRAELQFMRNAEAELEAMPYGEGGTVENANRHSDRSGQTSGQSDYVRRSGGAPIYHDILERAPGDSDLSRSEVEDGIRRTLETGDWNSASIGAYRLARERIAAGHDPSRSPSFAADKPLLGTVETVPLPVDLRPFKSATKPLYEQLMRERELVPLMGDKGRALVALDRLHNGPDVARASAVDAALGDLKAMARGAAMPELRSQGQGAAAFAVQELDKQVRKAVGAAGQPALDALETGRANTVGKYQVADVLKDLREEPAQTFQRLTARGDSQIGILRRVADAAPNAVPTIARAWIDQQLGTATERGRFDHADRLYADWRRMGPATKQLLFPDAEHRAALEHFFLLAKRLQENPNPSGTAHVNNVFNWASTAVSWPAAKLLQTPAGAKFVSRLITMRLPPMPSGVQTAAQRAAWIQVATAARAVGLPMAVPAAARDSEQERGTQP